MTAIILLLSDQVKEIVQLYPLPNRPSRGVEMGLIIGILHA